MKNEWFCTDDGCSQYCKINDDGTYNFIEKVWLDTCEGEEWYPNKEYTVKSACIDLDDYDINDRECAICGYYDSLAKAYETYGDGTEQIIAECIFENMCNGECSTYGMMTEVEADEFIQKYINEDNKVMVLTEKVRLIL